MVRERESRGVVGGLRMPFGWQLTLWLVLALLVAAGAGFLLWWGLGSPDFRGGTLNPRERLELIKIALAVTGGIGGVVALVVAYRRQQLNEAEHRLKEAEYRRDDTKLFNERYTSAVDQLGSDKAAIRLGGVYAMAGLADDWEAGRQKCIDVLCAYLRMPYTPAADPDDDEAREAAGIEDKAAWSIEQGLRNEERQVRHTVTRVIRDHLRESESGGPGLWCGHDFDFTGAVFDGGDFTKAVFSGGTIHFTDAQFTSDNVNFTDAQFTGGDVSFFRAQFTGGNIDFFRAQFTGGNISFFRAQFTGGKVNFTDAQFTGGNINFFRAQFTGGDVSFFRAQFTGGDVHFTDAQFTGGNINFFRAQFTSGNINFFRAQFTGGSVNFGDAGFTGGDVDFFEAQFTSGNINFFEAQFTSGNINFFRAQFTGGDVSFNHASFTGSNVHFTEVKFTGSDVNFLQAQFTGGDVSFFRAQFTGGNVNFSDAEFTGGRVDLSEPARYDTPPRFDAWENGQPAGLLLPPAQPSAGQPAVRPATADPHE